MTRRAERTGRWTRRGAGTVLAGAVAALLLGAGAPLACAAGPPGSPFTTAHRADAVPGTPDGLSRSFADADAAAVRSREGAVARMRGVAPPAHHQGGHPDPAHPRSGRDAGYEAVSRPDRARTRAPGTTGGDAPAGTPTGDGTRTPVAIASGIAALGALAALVLSVRSLLRRRPRSRP
ncbi:hypothetical protein ACWCP6_16555 [Streptomyces sp. NPDC002004]